MIGVDTNIVVRLLTGDDPAQLADARRLFAADEILLPDTVILETEWVLRFAYGLSPAAIHAGLLRLCGLPNVVLRDARAIARALDGYRQGLDFADSLHLALCEQCSDFFTFDRKLVRDAPANSRCKVRHP